MLKNKKGAVTSRTRSVPFLLKSKKGLAFFGLISIFMIIIYFYILLIYQVPTIDLIEEIKVYNKQIVNIDKIKQKKIIGNFYMNEVLSRINNQVLDSISNLNYLSNSQKSIRKNNKCKINDLNLWYDEREKEDNNYTKCLPEFEKELPSIIEEIIKNEGGNLDLNSELNLDVEYNKEKKSYLVLANSDLKKESKVGSVTFKNNLTFEINLDKFSLMIKAITKILPEFSKNNKNVIPKCLSENKNNDEKNSEKLLNCLSKNFENLINAQNKNLLKDFNIELSYIEKSNIENHFSLKFKIIQKNSKQSINFGIVIKDNIPQGLVSFTIKNYKKADNIIELKIEKPKSNSKIEGYIILYSYDNFFDKSYEGFDELNKILNTKKVPEEIKEVPFSKNNNAVSLNNGIIYRIFENEKLNLNLLNIGSKNFDEDKDEKNIYIFQTYNYKTEKFEKFDPNKEIYFYVFAYDKNYNYYVEEIDKTSTKKIKSKTNFGPMPLVKNIGSNNFKNILISGDEIELDKSIKINIPIDFYIGKNFDRYDVYIFKGKDRDLATDKTIKIQCADSEFICNYINGNSNDILKNRDLDIILTSDENLKDNKNTIYLKDVIKNNEKYDVLIVPMDREGRGILNPTSIEYKIMPEEKSDFYYIGLGAGSISPKIKTDIEIKDRMAPNPQNSISILNNNQLKKIIEDNGVENLYLQWQSNIENEISTLSVTINKYGIDGQLKESIPTLIGIDGFILRLKSNIGKIVVDKIIPIDSSGNKIDIKSYTGETYSATYII